MNILKRAKKKLATIFLISYILNILSPYTMLFAAVDTSQPYVVLKNGYDPNDPDFEFIQEDYEKDGFIPIHIAIGGDSQTIYGVDLNISYNKDVLTPWYNASTRPGRVDYKAATTMTGFLSYYSDESMQPNTMVSSLNTSDGSFRYVAASATGVPILTGTVVVQTFLFHINDGYTIDDVTNDLFSLKLGGSGNAKGIKVSNDPTGSVTLAGAEYFMKDGFAAGEKTITNVQIKSNPTKTTYDHGDTINLAGGELTVTYSDDSSEDISMLTSGVSIASGSPAKVSNPKVKVAYQGFENEFNIAVLDPVDKLEINTPMTKNEYTQDDGNIVFTGLVLKATKRSGATETFSYPHTGVTVSETTASVNSPKFTQTSPDGVVPARGTQDIVFTYCGKTATQTIIVNDTVTGVQVKSQPTKKVYKYNKDNLDLSGASIEVSLGSGDKKIINLPNAGVTVSGFSSTTTGSVQHLPVNFGVYTATGTIDVEVYDWVSSTTVTSPTKTFYNYNEDLELAGGKLNLIYKSSNVSSVNLTSTTVTGYDKTNPDRQTLTVSYNIEYTLSDGTTKIQDTLTNSFVVEVKDTAQTITITPPTKNKYKHGESLVLTTGGIHITYINAQPDDIGLQNATIREANGSVVVMNPPSYDSTNKIEKTLKISYSEDSVNQTVDYPITLVNDVKSIAIVNSPKTVYNVNDSLDLTGGTVKVTWAVGEATIPMTDSRITVTGLNTSSEVTGQTLSVTFNENGYSASTSYDIDVTDTIKDIEIKTLPKTSYKYNENLNLTNGVITVKKGSGNTDVAMTAGTVSVTGYTKTTLGTQTLTVSYSGFSKTFDVTVSDYATGITVTAPTKTSYDYDEDLNLAGASYVINYASGDESEPVTITSAMVGSQYNKRTLGNQTITISATTADGTFDDSFTVTVNDVLDNIALTSPTKTIYRHGEALDLTGAKIVKNYKSGAKVPVTVTASMFTESDGSVVNMSPATYSATTNKVEKTLKFIYGEEEEPYSITIVNDVKTIAVHTSPKTTYNVNDSLSLTGGEISVHRAVGSSDEIISMEDERVSVTGLDTSAEVTGQTLAVRFTENTFYADTSYNVDVVDSITGFVIKTKPKTSYLYDEDLSLTGGILTVSRGSGTTDIPMSSATVTGYNKKLLGTQELTVSYGGFSKKFDVTVSDYATGITVTGPTKSTYNYDEELDLTGASYVVNYASGDESEPVTITAAMVGSQYNKQTLGNQTINISATTADGTFSDSFTVTVNDVLDNIVLTNPTKTIYKHGEALDLTGAKIEKNYKSGAKVTETVTTSMFTETDGSTVNMSPASYGTTNKVTKNLKFKYSDEEKNYVISIINDVKNITIHTSPKTLYNVNEELDLTNGEITVHRAVDTNEIISMSDSRVKVTGFNASSEATNQPLTVTFTENEIAKTTSYNIDVVDSISGFVIKTEPKKNYLYNEDLSVTGGVLTVSRGSGDTDIPMTASMVSGYNKTLLGDQTLTVNYGGFSKTYNVTVEDYVTGITVTGPTKSTYNYDEELDLTGASYVENKASGATGTPVQITSAMVGSQYDKNTLGSQVITIAAGGFSDTFTVTVNDVVSSSTLVTPTKAVYKHGETLDLTGAEIVQVYVSGTTNTVTVTDAMFTEADGSVVDMSPASYDNTNKVDKTLKFTYGGQTINWPIAIVNDVKGVTIHTTPKTSYNVNESLDLTGGEVEVQRAVGSNEVISMSDSRVKVTGFSTSSEVTNKPVTVTFTENGFSQTTSYNIDVVDTVTDISLVTDLSGNVKYNEEIDLTNAKIEVTRGSGTSQIAVTPSMLSGYNKSNLGTQEVTVTYGGKTATFNVTVLDYVTGISVNPDTVTGTYDDEMSTLITDNTITYTVTYAKAGAKDPVALTTGMVTGYNKQTLSNQALTVSYTDEDVLSFTKDSVFTTTLNVALSDDVSDITIIAPSKTSYLYDEELDLAGGEIVITRPSGVTREPITSSMISGYSKTTLGEQTLTITYNPTTADTYTVTVSDYMLDYVLTAPTKVDYLYGEELDLAGAKITKVMASGDTTQEITLPNDSVTVSGYDKNLAATQAVTVNYDGISKTFPVTVVDNVLNIEMEVTPEQNYNYGDALDITGGKIKVTRASGDEEVISITSSMVSGFDSSVIGTQTLTVSYEGKQTSYTVEVSDYATGIRVTKPTKLIYNVGEELDLTDGYVSIVMASGDETTPVALDSTMVSGFDSSVDDNIELTVSYGGFTDTFNVVIVDPCSDVSLKSLPNKVNYLYGEALDLTGATLEVETASGAKKIVDITNDMISGYNPTVLGSQEITATYKGFDVKFSVNVADYIVGLKITKPTKQVYEYGENINVDGGKVGILMASGAVEYETDMTTSMLSEFDNHKVGTQKIDVSYRGIEGNFNLKVVDTVQGITLKTEPSKVKYEYGEDINLDGAEIDVIRTSGVKTINVTKSMISGYDSKQPGKQIITVRYEGKTATFVVEVGEKPQQVVAGPVYPTYPTSTDKEEAKEEEKTTVLEKVEEKLPAPKPAKPVQTPTKEEVLDEFEEVQNTKVTMKAGAIIIGMLAFIGMLIALLVVLFKANTKIYVEYKGQFILCGKTRVSKNNLRIDVDDYLDDNTYENPVKVVFNDYISEKLDSKVVKIKYRGTIIEFKIDYDNQPYEILLTK